MTQNSLDRYRVLKETGVNFLTDRPLMREHNHGSLLTVLKLLAGEVGEAIESVEDGDGIIEDNHVAIEQELADIGILLFTCFEVLGSDPYYAMMEKHMRNMLKYPAVMFSDVDEDYDDVIQKAKSNWSIGNGNHGFYNGHSKYMIDFDKRSFDVQGSDATNSGGNEKKEKA